MINSEFQETIHIAIMRAYQTGLRDGRLLENTRFWKAIDLNSTFNDIGDYIYLNDLKDALEEVSYEKASQVS